MTGLPLIAETIRLNSSALTAVYSFVRGVFLVLPPLFYMFDRLSNPEVGLINQVSVSPKLPKLSLSSPVFVPGERMTPLVGTL